ncbi:MAG: ATP-binding protein [Eubacteriales bacterium]
MNIAVLSGKGGTGKTFVSVNLAESIGNCCYIDCDVEEPNGHLFLKPEHITVRPVTVKLPLIIKERCNGCRQCVEFCHFNALAIANNKPIVFHGVCHSCGGCKLVCPNHAMEEKDYQIGEIQTGKHKNITVKTGIMNMGEESGVPIIRTLLKDVNHKINIIDCPPGSACTVMESIHSADFCIIVAEPTIFGTHNFQLVYELVKLLNKPFGVVINKASSEDNPMEKLCAQLNLPILERIPFDYEIATENATGNIAYGVNEKVKDIFDRLRYKIM